MRRLAILMVAAALIFTVSCTPAVGWPNLQTYTLPATDYSSECGLEVEVGQEGSTAFLRVRDFGLWYLGSFSNCGYIELRLTTNQGSITCEWGKGELRGSTENAACPGSRNLSMGGSWFGSAKWGTLQSASIFVNRFPDDTTIINVYP